MPRELRRLMRQLCRFVLLCLAVGLLVHIEAPSARGVAPDSTSVRVLSGHQGAITSICISPDGRFLASGSLDKTVRLWEVATGKNLRVMRGHTDEVYAVAFSRDGQYLASSGYDRRVIVWETATGRIVRKISLSSWSTAIGFSSDGHLGVADQDGSILLLNAKTGATLRKWKSDFGVFSLAFSPDGRSLVTGGPIYVWNSETGEKMKGLPAPGGIAGMAFSQDGQFLVTAHWRGSARLWNFATGQLISTLEPKVTRRVRGPSGTVTVDLEMPMAAAAFSPDGKFVLTAGEDRAVRVWDVSTHKEVRQFTGHTMAVTGLAFTSDGKYLASGSLDGTVRLWLF